MHHLPDFKSPTWEWVAGQLRARLESARAHLEKHLPETETIALRAEIEVLRAALAWPDEKEIPHTQEMKFT
jgi:hypothetical protein